MYPDKIQLKTVKNWPLKTWHDYRNLALYVKSIWEYPEAATLKGNTFRLATVGWSGNEDIVGALYKNLAFSFCWEMSKRGGLHIFKLPNKKFFK